MEHESQFRIIYLYQILARYSGADHPISTKQIIRIMEEQHNIKMHRTTVPKDISVLNECGIEVLEVRARDKKYYLNKRTFETADLKTLIDAVETSRYLPSGKSRELIKELLSTVSKGDAGKFKRNIYTVGKARRRSEKEQHIIDVINDAINTGRRIAFYYFDYNVRKRQVEQNDRKPYVLSPYSLIWSGEHYYVVGYDHTMEHIGSFRADRIKNDLYILDEAADPKPKDLDISKYTDEGFRMHDTDKPVTVTLRCDNELMKYIIDQFGMKVDTQPIDEDHFEAKVTVCAGSTFYSWVFGWRGGIQITDPPEVKNEYKKMIEETLEGIED